MPPKEIIVLDEFDDEIEITGSRPSKIAKTSKVVAPSDLALEPNHTTCYDLTGPSTTFESSHKLPSLVLSPSRDALDQGSRSIFEQNWSFTALNCSPQLSSSSTSRTSSTTLLHSLSSATLVAVLPDNEGRADVSAATSSSLPSDIVALDLTNDEDDDIIFVDQGSSGTSDNVIDLEDFEYDDAEAGPEIYEIEDDSEPKDRRLQRTKVLPRRNGPVESPFKTLSTISLHNLTLTSDMVVEVVELGMIAEDAYFLSIVSIISNDTTGEVTLRGHRLQRTKDGNGILEKKLNEVYLCREVDLDDPRRISEQSIIEVPLNNVVRTRNLRYTNRNFPRARYIGNNFGNDQKPHLYEEGGLTLRWIYTCVFLTATHRNHNKYGERVIERLHSTEVVQHGVLESSLRQTWRGDTIPGGAYIPSASLGPDYHGMSSRLTIPSTSKRSRQVAEDRVESTRRRLSVIDLSNNARRTSSNLPRTMFVPLSPVVGELHSNSIRKQSLGARKPGQKYTFGDAFCGAGGTTRGAEMAGLRVIWGFDLDETACTTWRSNFDADCYQMEAFKFADIFKNTNGAIVDILHLSPPCQFFAPCHTRPGPNDEANSAALFAVQEITKIAKPRVVTLEQTLGLGRQRQHQGYLNSLIQMFTRAGFSVRWKIVFLAPWGLPARRERLVIIASCPGEMLPNMPQPTHSEGGEGGLKPYVTVNQTIASLHPSTNLDPDIKYFDAVQLQHPKIHPYDGNNILPKAITCSGGDYNYHPSGKRGFTVREFAALQGFPPVHTFSGMSSHGMGVKGRTIVVKQIGNAVPPVVARTLFESIIKDLKKADGIESEHILIE